MLHTIKSLLALPFGAASKYFSWAYGSGSNDGRPTPQGERKNGQQSRVQYATGAVAAFLFAVIFLVYPVFNEIQLFSGNAEAVERIEKEKQAEQVQDEKTLIVSSKGEGQAYIMGKSALNQWMQKTGKPWTHHPSYTRYGIASGLQKLDNWLGTGNSAGVEDIPEAIPYNIDTKQTLIVSVNTDLGQGVCLNKQMQKVQCDQIHRDNLKNVANFEQFKTKEQINAPPKQIGAVVAPLPDLTGLEHLPLAERVTALKKRYDEAQAAVSGYTKKGLSRAMDFVNGGDGGTDTRQGNLKDLQATAERARVQYYTAIFETKLPQGSNSGRSFSLLGSGDAQATTTAALATVAPVVTALSLSQIESLRGLLATFATIFIFLGLVSMPVYGLLKRFVAWQIGFVGLALLVVYWFSFPYFGDEIRLFDAGAFLRAAPVFALIFLPTYIMVAWEAIKETQFYREIWIEGKGDATGRWGSVLSYFRHDVSNWFKQSKGSIQKTTESPLMIGQTMWNYEPALGGRWIGTKSEQHLLTIAGTGAGKSRDSIMSNLLTYNGGIVAFDTKRELTEAAYIPRKQYAPAYIVDPWNEGKDGLKTDYWNPLNEIDINKNEARSRILRLCESLIVKEGTESRGRDAHFREVPQQLMAGYIAHVLSSFPLENQNLPTIYNLMVLGVVNNEYFDPDACKNVIFDMSKNPVANGLAVEAAARLEQLEGSERSGMLSTLSRSLKWVKDPDIEKNISQISSFSLADCKTKDASVFLVVPEEKLTEQKRYLGLFYQVAFDMMDSFRTEQQENSKRRVLFLFDEFQTLGAFEPAREAVLRKRSSNIKCWFILQNMAQLDVFGNIQDFLSNCDIQMFGISKGDPAILKFLREALGEFTATELRNSYETDSVEKSRYPLMDESEIKNFLDAAGDKQLFIPQHGFPMKLRRVHYDDIWRQYKRR